MPKKQVAPYGAWKSPITTDLIVAESVRFMEIAVEGRDVYWSEMRPSEGGRYVIVRCDAGGAVEDVTPPPFNVRTRVHEYGGGAFTVSEGTVYFSNFSDQRLYVQKPGSEPVALSRGESMRYADASPDRARQRLILVREDHSVSDVDAVNTIVSLSYDGSAEQVLVSGSDFYSTPRLSPDGRWLSWLAWNHPNMPWDGCELRLAAVQSDGSLSESRLVAGGIDEAIFQPEWSPAGVLHWVSDRSGWGNLYRLAGDRTEALWPMDAEFAQPQWVFGTTTYGFLDDDRLLCTYTSNGRDHLAILDSRAHQLLEVETPYSVFENVLVAGGRAVFIAGSSNAPSVIAAYDPSARMCTELRRSSMLTIDPAYISVAQHIEFPSQGDRTAYGFLYLPASRDFEAPESERPPLLVKSHGGPTGATSHAFNATIQYWTSRGIAVLDVNYGGSTGYGREFQRRLNGQWGIVDVEDCVNGATHLAGRGLVDGKRLLIDGGSAGGYTTLAVLTFRDEFSAGASYFGVSDVEALATDTHKFESRYMDSMIGPYPERRDLYLERSPIQHVDQLARPLILFQGLEDKVVPPSQAVTMYEAVKAKGLPVAYIPFEGEQHGFRKAENIKRALEAEFYFFATVLGFTPADTIEPVEIANLRS